MSKLLINDVVLRDGHQSLFATRMRIEDMLPVAEKLDSVGYWALETWGGATFDSCIRFLGEDPWERLRELNRAMPKTQQMMLLRGQNLLGYRHYADDVVYKFVERAAANGMDVFRVFDAMNDVRNLQTAVKAVIANEKHAQGTISYTVSKVHSIEGWIEMGRKLEDLGCHSICIKDMAGLLTPYVAEELVKGLKKATNLPINLHAHATTGFSTATIVKAVEAGLDIADTSISSMSLTYGHSPTETVVSIFKDTEYDTGIDIAQFEPIADHFKEVRKKYWKFEGELKGVDARIINAQVPGGMLTNMENQLKEQGFGDRLGEVLAEVPRVRADLGFIPLVTPTSQIVGTQAVLNVITGERYKSITKETRGVLLGEYGAAPAPVDEELQQRVLQDGGEVITVRPADKLADEMDSLLEETRKLAKEENIDLAEHEVDDALIYALFQQVGLKFLKNRGDKSAFEPAPEAIDESAVTQPVAAAPVAAAGDPEAYTVVVDGQKFSVVVGPGDADISVAAAPAATEQAAPAAAPAPTGGKSIDAPLSGNIFKVNVQVGQTIAENDVVVILEAMKMETEVRSTVAGTVQAIQVKEGDAVNVGQALLVIA